MGWTTTKVTRGVQEKERHTYTETISAGVTSSPVYIGHYFGESVSVAVHPTAGTLKVQYTISTPTEIDASTAVWFDWTTGATSADKHETLSMPIMAIRFVPDGTGAGSATIFI